MRRLRLALEYDGTDFHGWQFQPGTRTVQGELEKALSQVLNQRISLIGSGRTDAGVHAAGQVAHLDAETNLECENIRLGVNSQTGKDVQVLLVKDAADDFHARFDAKSREYKYRVVREYRPLMRRFSWFPNCEWSDDLISEAVRELPGKHSFMAFSKARPDEEEYECNIFIAEWVPDEQGATLKIIANRFMHRMVRGIVGSLIDHGRGFVSFDEFKRMLHEPKRNGEVRSAPPQGLTLVEVTY